jgi:hypothetical protein
VATEGFVRRLQGRNGRRAAWHLMICVGAVWGFMLTAGSGLGTTALGDCRGIGPSGAETPPTGNGRAFGNDGRDVMKQAPRNPKHPLTPGYVFFYCLFSPETWRILIGVVAAIFITPRLQTVDLALSGRLVLGIMLAVIGYTLAARPGRWIADRLRQLVLGKTRP